ncbi:hypothetical protein [Streptomyces silvensis]|uniref:Uncharacterized protein n=1 Tax=Streptomyces silvensis TaxID=1765722 RepID=A0A0W7X7N1_9ACTN|nr:hypothetical protein [Streptomyces silvensis]KUF18816.1 hypothetical protein AT728_07205 [Streptomyces silvensis]
MTTPDEVRAIVREEIRAAFAVLKTQAGDHSGDDTIDYRAASVLSSVAESTADMLRHAPDCKIRRDGGYFWDCDCAVRDEDAL